MVISFRYFVIISDNYKIFMENNEELLKQMLERLKKAETENQDLKKDLATIVNFIGPIVSAVATGESVNVMSLLQSMPKMISEISADQDRLTTFAETFNKYVK